MSLRISFRPTSDRQKEDIELYAEVKGFKDASAFALYATVTMMNKNGLTGPQKARVEELREERKKTQA